MKKNMILTVFLLSCGAGMAVGQTQRGNTGTGQLISVAAQAQQDVDKYKSRHKKKDFQEARLRNEEAVWGMKASKILETRIPLIQEPSVLEYVSQVGQKLNKSSSHTFPLTIRIINDSSIQIFDLPGGYLYLSRGVITTMENEEELASALAPWIARIDRRDSAAEYREYARISRMQSIFLLWPFFPSYVPQEYFPMSNLQVTNSRFAYEKGTQLMIDAGYNPQVMLSVERKLIAHSRGEKTLSQVDKGWLSMVNSVTSHTAPASHNGAVNDTQDNARFEQVKALLSK